MAIETKWCPVRQATVVLTTTFEGEVTSVACAKLDPLTKDCRLKQAMKMDTPLSRLVESVSEETLGRLGSRCNFT